MPRDQGAQRPDHFHQARRQGDLLLRLAQGGAHQVGVFRVAPPAGEGDLAAMGGQTGGAQGQHQLRIVAAGDGHQHGRLGKRWSVSSWRGRCASMRWRSSSSVQFILPGFPRSCRFPRSWHESPGQPTPPARGLVASRPAEQDRPFPEEEPGMKFCSLCGATVVQRIPDGDNRLRYVCDACHTVHYQNPRIVAGSLPVWDGQVLLCRRAIAPRLGYWTLPAGFMENGETSPRRRPAKQRKKPTRGSAACSSIPFSTCRTSARSTCSSAPSCSTWISPPAMKAWRCGFSTKRRSLVGAGFSDHRPYLRMLLQRPPRRLLPGAQRSHCTYAGFL